MEIKKIRLQNFLSFGNSIQEMDFSKLSTIVGPNDSGKTNVFRAIEIVANVMDGNQVPLAAYYHDKNFELPPKIEIDLKINDEEKEVLVNFFTCSCLYDRIIAHEDESEAARKVLKRILDEKGKDFFSNFFDELTVIVDTEGKSNYPAQYYFKMRKNGKNLFYRMHHFDREPHKRGGSHSIRKLEHVILDKAKIQFPELNDFIANSGGEIPNFDSFTLDLLTTIYDECDESRYVEPTGFQFNEFEAHQENIPEFIRLRDFVRRMNAEKDGITFMSIISILFKSSLTKIANLRSTPKPILDPQDLFYEKEMLNLSGTNLVKVLYSLSQSDDPSVKERFHGIVSEFEQLASGLKLDMTFRPKMVEVTNREIVSIGDGADLKINNIGNLGISNRTKNVARQEVGLQVIKNGIPIPIELISAGITELIVLLTALIGQQNKVILLDEPAANLHPILQRRIMQIIQNAVQKNNNQVIMITHSPFLIIPENFEHVCKFSSSINGTEILNLGKTIKSMDDNAGIQLVGRLHRSEVREILFQRGIVMVEGLSDKIVLEKIDQYFADNKVGEGPSIGENEWFVLDVEGKKSLPLMIKLAQKLKIPHISVLDYDGLMQYAKKIRIGDKDVRTSLVISCIDQTDGLTDTEKKLIADLEKTISEHTETCNGKTRQLWYDESNQDRLNEIAREHNFYVLTRDLEGALQSPATPRDSKPLRALERIDSLLRDNEIPAEIRSLVAFLKDKIKEQNDKIHSKPKE